MKGAKQHVAQKSDRFTFPLLVLSQAERPGRALAGGTSGGLHLHHLRGLLSADHAERAGEAAGHSSFINVARSSCISLRHSQESKSVDVGKGVGKTVDGDGQRLSGGRPRIAGEALIPCETVMGPLCPSDDECVWGFGVRCGWCPTPGQGD
jgi:hypothetical protein